MVLLKFDALSENALQGAAADTRTCKSSKAATCQLAHCVTRMYLKQILHAPYILYVYAVGKECIQDDGQLLYMFIETVYHAVGQLCTQSSCL